MLFRLLGTILLLSLPAMILGTDPGKPKSVSKPVVQGAVKGILIQFEVREVEVFLQGKKESIYCLCADVTNQQNQALKILLRYDCQGQDRIKEYKLEGKQQRLILVDRCVPKDEINKENKKFFTLVQLEQSQ